MTITQISEWPLQHPGPGLGRGTSRPQKCCHAAKRMTRNIMTLARASTEDRKQDKRDPRRDSSTATVPSNPIQPPFLSDGPEMVRDSHC
jgi:hypothetical protein